MTGFATDDLPCLGGEHADRYVPAPDPTRCRLGGGGGGVVFRMSDRRLGRLVALKVLGSPGRPGTPDDRTGIAMLRREARLLAGLRHEGIAVVLDLIDDLEGRPVIVMEYASGGSLRDHLDEARPAPDLAHRLDLLEQTARAVHAAHLAGVYHRDLKPANVLVVDPDRPRVRVADFGLAALRRHPAERSGPAADHTTVTAALAGGTPGYAAPEQLAGAAPSARADVFGFGALATAVLGGAPPWPARSLAAYARAVMDTPPGLASVAGVCPGIIPILKACLAVEPRKRPARLAEVAAAIADLRRGPALAPPADRRSAPAHARPIDGRLAPDASNEPGLPAFHSTWIDRDPLEREVADAIADHRLVTLVGAGGCGKTRLALHVASRLVAAGGGAATLATLDAIEHDDDVVRAIASAVGGTAHDHAGLIDAVGDHARLLILDNCEHVRGAVADAAVALLGRRPHLHVLATSREPLGLPGERTVGVPSMSTPEGEPATIAELAHSEAGRLLLDRMRLSGGTPPTHLDAAALATICRLLDGIPFAIELAAAATRRFEPADLARQLLRGLRLRLAGPPGRTPRHRTMHALIDWSWTRLDDVERRVLSRLSVFAGGWTLERAERVVGEPGGGSPSPEDVSWTIGRLVDRSLVMHEAAGRYRLLETVRAFAEERLLEDSAADEVRHRHVAAMVELARCEADALSGDVAPPAGTYERLDEEAANLLAASERLLSAAADEKEPGRLEIAALLVLGLARWRFIRARYAEGRRLAEALFDRLESVECDDATLGRATRMAGVFAFATGDHEAAADRHARSLAAWRRVGDAAQAAISLTNLGAAHEAGGRLPEAIAANEEAARVLDELGTRPLDAARVRLNLAAARLRSGEPAAAMDDLDRGLVRLVGLDRLAEAHGRLTRASAAFELGRTADAVAELDRVWSMAHHELGQPQLAARCVAMLARLRAEEGALDEALRLADAATGLAERHDAGLGGTAGEHLARVRLLASSARSPAVAPRLRGSRLDEAVRAALRAAAPSDDDSATLIDP